jgi:hypothetical protein
MGTADDVEIFLEQIPQTLFECFVILVAINVTRTGAKIEAWLETVVIRLCQRQFDLAIEDIP